MLRGSYNSIHFMLQQRFEFALARHCIVVIAQLASHSLGLITCFQNLQLDSIFRFNAAWQLDNIFRFNTAWQLDSTFRFDAAWQLDNIFCFDAAWQLDSIFRFDAAWQLDSTFCFNAAWQLDNAQSTLLYAM